ncbi:hypothetical protein [Streptomyces sp. NBC_01443]|uniref:hypothetical protein n=1 Tax=Streptomyces sp. NBC_01443 TaxID=2903868 RepID=UPI002259260D|nr:hypothetical protein [Streptomyces sp. NBC_01443]MCX4632287.1 hypothetical protein [Streptomyces sp. NBC_01443]
MPSGPGRPAVVPWGPVMVDHPGIDGALGVIDSCHAGWEPPQAEDLAGAPAPTVPGWGLPMASSPGQPAVGLAVSRHYAAWTGCSSRRARSISPASGPAPT